MDVAARATCVFRPKASHSARLDLRGVADMRLKLVVSDHAVLRLIQRRLGIDTEAVRSEIAKTLEPVHGMGASAAQIDGLTFTIRGNTVTTALPGRRSTSSAKQVLEARV